MPHRHDDSGLFHGTSIEEDPTPRSCPLTFSCMAHVGRSENNWQELVLSFHHVKPNDQNQLITLGGKHYIDSLAQTFSASIFEDEAGRMPQIQGQLGLQCEFHTKLGYKSEICLQTKKILLFPSFLLHFSPLRIKPLTWFLVRFFFMQGTAQIYKSCSSLNRCPTHFSSSFLLSLVLIEGLDSCHLPATCLQQTHRALPALS